jgi:hypothetical protein
VRGWRLQAVENIFFDIVCIVNTKTGNIVKLIGGKDVLSLALQTVNVIVYYIFIIYLLTVELTAD